MGNICDEIKECPDCMSFNISCNREREQVICRDCGLIFEPYTVVADLGEAREVTVTESTRKPPAKKVAPKKKKKAAPKKKSKKTAKKKVTKKPKKKAAKKRTKKKVAKKNKDKKSKKGIKKKPKPKKKSTKKKRRR